MSLKRIFSWIHLEFFFCLEHAGIIPSYPPPLQFYHLLLSFLYLLRELSRFSRFYIFTAIITCTRIPFVLVLTPHQHWLFGSNHFLMIFFVFYFYQFFINLSSINVWNSFSAFDIFKCNYYFQKHKVAASYILQEMKKMHRD